MHLLIDAIRKDQPKYEAESIRRRVHMRMGVQERLRLQVTWGSLQVDGRRLMMLIVLQRQLWSTVLSAEQHASLGGPLSAPGTTYGAHTVSLLSPPEQSSAAATIWVRAARPRSTSMTARREYLTGVAIACLSNQTAAES